MTKTVGPTMGISALVVGGNRAAWRRITWSMSIITLKRDMNMQTELLRVSGMTCGGCISTVTHALRAISGVGEVNASLAAGEVTVQYDEKLTSPEKLKAAVKSAGYGVDQAAAQGHKARGGCCS